MKKTRIALIALLALILLVTACGGNNAGNPSSGSSSGPGSKQASSGGETKRIKIFNFKVEMVESLQKAAKIYEEQNPGIKIEVETVGGSGDYNAGLKAEFASGDEPDIFFNSGYAKLDLWEEYLEDLSDQPWVEDVIPSLLIPITKDGKIYGMPLNMEGQGIVYNKDLFAQAGIDKVPGTLAELEEASQKLQAIGVIPFSNGYQEFWLLGGFINVAMLFEDDPDAFIEKAKNGTADFNTKGFNEMLNFVDLTVKYGNPNPLTTDYSTNVSMIATGEAAMMFQGNWTQPIIDEISPGMNVGIFPVPTTNEGESVILGFPPSNWVINKKSQVKEEAKAFLTWIAKSKEGHDFMVKDSMFIPAFHTVSFEPEDLGPIAVDVQSYGDQLKPVNAEKMPEGTAQEFSNILQAYIGGQIDRTQFFDQVAKSIHRLATTN